MIRFLLSPLFVTVLFGAAPPESTQRVVPSRFESFAAAEKYARELFAGGSVETCKINQREFLILQVLGSGVPDIALAVYAPTKDGWKLCAEWHPETIERHNVFVSEGAFMIRGAKTGKTWLLFRPDEKKGLTIKAHPTAGNVLL